MTQNLPKPNLESPANGNGKGRSFPAPPPLISHPEIEMSVFSDMETTENLLDHIDDSVASPSSSSSARSLMQKLDSKGWWAKQSLRAKATMAAVVLGTVPVLGVGVLSYGIANQTVTQSSTVNTQARTTTDSEKLARFMFERFGDINIIANLPILTNPRGTVGIPAAQKQVVLSNFANTYGVYDSIAVYSLQGGLVLRSEQPTEANIADSPEFQKAIQTGERVISQPQVSAITKQPVVYFYGVVRNFDTKQPAFVVRSRMPIIYLENILKASSGQDEYHITDASGKFFVTEEGNQLGRDAASDFPSAAEFIQSKTLGNVIGIDKIDGAQQLISYAPLPKIEDLPDLGWGTILALDTDIVFASQRALLLSLGLGTLATIVLVSALAAFLANRATKPIVDAASAAEKIGQGQLGTRLTVLGEDEVATLGTNLNTMASRLQGMLQEQETAAGKAQFLTAITAELRAADEDGLNRIFDQSIEKALFFLEVDRVVIYRFKPDGSGYISNESVAMGLPRATEDKIEDPCIPQTLLEAYRSGRVVPTSDVRNANFHPAHMSLMERLHIRANLVVPILNQGQLFGLLVAHQCTQTYNWQESEIVFLKQLATQLGVAVSVQEVEAARKTAEVLAGEQTELKESLQRRALELLMAVDPVSRGDLTVRANVTDDEIGTVADSYNATIASLRKIVLQVQDAAQQVVSTTNTNESAVRELSTGALQQTTEIAAALERIQEMANSIQAVATNAQQAETAVQQAAQTVQSGDAAMNRTVEGILAIRETVGETAKKVKRLGESSQKISKVVNLIGTFAAQTNQLALNASIEAARAGEEGRGFAVVADEVRSLARQSAEATAEIEKLVASIQAETNEVVAAMEAGTEQVVMGTQLVDETRQNLTQIAAVSTQINDLVRSIAQAAQMQSRASESVTKTMTDVATIADQNSAEAIQVSDSFKQLLDVAQSLQDEVGQFKVR